VDLGHHATCICLMEMIDIFLGLMKTLIPLSLIPLFVGYIQ
jgi:hypothetical protein